MRNAKLRYRELRDPYTKRFWPFRPGRDPARTPMQWNGTAQAGFTHGRPWLPVAPDYAEHNVTTEAADPCSLLSLYKRLIALRRSSAALMRGGTSLVKADARDCLLYERKALSADGTTDRMLTMVNFSERQTEVTLPGSVVNGRTLLSTDSAATLAGPVTRQMRLGPNEGRLVQILD
jgi:alpha-glucosidase